jgi:hypothetical protein
MIKLIRPVSALIILFALLGLQACQTKTGARLLRLDLEKGKSYEFEVVTDQQQQMMDKESEINMTARYRMDVIDATDDIQTLKVTYGRFKMYMKVMGFVLDIDTDNPPAPPTNENIQANPLGMMGNVFAGIKNRSFTLQLDREGKVISVQGFEKIMQEMIDPLDVDDNTKLQIRASLSDQFNEENIKDQFVSFFNIFPNKEVKAGDTWEKSWKTSGRMPSSFVTTYTVKDIDGEHINLLTDTKISSDKKEMEIKGTQKGPLLVDSRSGLVVNGSLDQDIDAVFQDMEIKIKSNASIKGKQL